MEDWEWNLNQRFVVVVVVEGDGEENSYTGYSSGELIASAPQPVKNIKTVYQELIDSPIASTHKINVYITTIFASIWRSRTRFGEETISAAKVHERESILKSALIP